jgi:hypothetical protein
MRLFSPDAQIKAGHKFFADRSAAAYEGDLHPGFPEFCGDPGKGGHRRGQKSGPGEHDRPVQFAGFDHFVHRHVDAEVDHFKTSGVQKRIDDHLSDIVNIPFSGMSDHLRLFFVCPAHLLFADGDTGDHGIRRQNDLGKKIAADIPQTADLMHAGDQAFIDDRHGIFRCQGFTYHVCYLFFVAVDNVLRHSLQRFFPRNDTRLLPFAGAPDVIPGKDMRSVSYVFHPSPISAHRRGGGKGRAGGRGGSRRRRLPY